MTKVKGPYFDEHLMAPLVTKICSFEKRTTFEQLKEPVVRMYRPFLRAK
ncbi:hypothetical protein RU93_GL002254 [Enterococcus aquimarinus]|uniref:Uncharacterized protein n=1 Tax=Enterococcus aquimarinus TaxID=328396 RepID=A0A1L8QRX3_9ENTE|nr:hypothetical protein RU93_GL002254 [Enterococcus aquimarinus]